MIQRGGYKVSHTKAGWKSNCRVDINGCWIWKFMISDRGYARIQYMGKCCRASRVAYILFKGPIPEGYEIAHSCDNKKCVNPKHLFAKTHSMNIKEWWTRMTKTTRKRALRACHINGVRSMSKLWRDPEFIRMARIRTKRQWKNRIFRKTVLKNLEKRW